MLKKKQSQANLRPGAVREPEPNRRGPTNATDRSRRDAIEVPAELRQHLSQSIDMRTEPQQTLRRPSDASSVAATPRRSLAERRGSSRSLQQLQLPQNRDRGKSVEKLPPSPALAHPQQLREFTRWGDEALSQPEKVQREQLVRMLVRALQEPKDHLIIESADLITDLPPALTAIAGVTHITLLNMPRLCQTLDFRGLVSLTCIVVSDCPHLRLKVRQGCEVTLDNMLWPIKTETIDCNASKRLQEQIKEKPELVLRPRRSASFLPKMLRL